MQVDTTIPLWAAITGFLVYAGSLIWMIIKFFYKVKDMERLIKEAHSKSNEIEIEQKALAKQIEARLQAAKEKHQEDLERHKKETDREFERVNKKLDTQNTVLIEVKTMVKLLVDNKIKD